MSWVSFKVVYIMYLMSAENFALSQGVLENEDPSRCMQRGWNWAASSSPYSFAISFAPPTPSLNLLLRLHGNYVLQMFFG